VLQLWPAEGSADLTLEETIARFMERHSHSVVMAVHLVYLLLRGECFYKVVDSSLAGEGSDDLATLVCAECRYMMSVKTVKPRIHLREMRAAGSL
jgi:hypothetical protein